MLNNLIGARGATGDELSPGKVMEIGKYDNDRDAQSLFQTQLREFIETKPLYSNAEVSLPPLRRHFQLDVARLYCSVCKTEQPFRKPDHESWYWGMDKYASDAKSKQVLGKLDLLHNGVFPIELVCQECKKQRSYFFVHVDVERNKVTKSGQMPLWLPRVEKDIAQELGTSLFFYQRGLRCLNESFGIGACAYFRRMVEDYVNPLLRLLREFKAEQGANAKQLAEIDEVISSKDFSAKTKYASEICPESLNVGGINPLKKLHDLLSYNIHVGSEAEATEIALQLRTTIEYVIRQLRRRYDEQKQFVESIKDINKIKP